MTALVVVAGLGSLVAVLGGFAATPAGWQVVCALAGAALLGVAATPLVRSAYATAVGAGKVSDQPSWSWPRVGAVVAAAVLLGACCWAQPGEPGRLLFSAAQAALGLVAYALPVLPLLALLPPAGAGPPGVPWQVLTGRDRSRADALRFATALARVLRHHLLGTPAGTVLAATALLHLLRGAPGFEAGGYRLAGGVLGMVLAAPTAALGSRAGALGLLLAVLACAALVTAGRLLPRLGRYPTVATLAVLVVLPVAVAGTAHFVGYRHYLAVHGDRMVVTEGLSPGHRHRMHDVGTALADLPAVLHPALRAGLPVTSRGEGARIAAALADPPTATADTLPDGGLPLKAGECFSFVGGSSNFRYVTPCNGEHTGETFYVGRLPFSVDPGVGVRDAAARGICEKAYGGYLGVPHGGSYLPMEPPVVQGGPWRPRPLVACVLPAVGPWSLRDTRTVAALGQQLDWAPGPGCRAERGADLRLHAEQAGVRCLAPGGSVSIPAAGGGGLVVDAGFAPVGKAAGNVRVGIACVGADAVAGYYATVGADGGLTLVKQAGAERVTLATGGRARAAASPQTVPTQVQLTCRPVDGGVELAASAGANRQASAVDRDRPVTGLSPRLVTEAAGVPFAATVTLFHAVRPA